MKKCIVFIFMVLSITPLCAKGVGEAQEEMRPKSLAVNNQQSIYCLDQGNNTPVYGKTITINWSPSPPEVDWFLHRANFEYYSITVYNQITGGTANYTDYQRSTSSYRITNLENGVFTITIKAVCRPYLIDDADISFLPGEYPWYSGATSIVIYVDHTPPLPPDPPPDLKNHTLQNGWEKTGENGTGAGGGSGYVTLRLITPTDSGPVENAVSGIAGYKVYEELPSGQDQLIHSFLSSAPPGTAIEPQIPLSEGEHKIKITAFDNITLLENNGDPSAVTESGKSLPAYFCVDRSGPEAVAINTGNLIAIPGKALPFVGNNSGISWNVPNDLPAKTENGTTTYIGIGAKDYAILITNTETGAVGNYTQSATTFLIPDNLASGKYSIAVIPKDAFGNVGQTNTPVVFCVDKTPPSAPDPDSFQIDDPLAQKTPGSATFQTRKKNCVITFAAVSDGDDEYASGLEGYRLYRENGAVTDYPANSISIAGLNPGTNNFTVTAVDRVGNESTPISLVLVLPTLQPATFPTPCYFLDGNVYYLRWNVPLNEGVPADIAYYKVIVRGRSQTAPGYSDFSSKEEVADRRYSLAGVEQGVELAAFVLAVAADGSWSIGSKEFSLPPLEVTGEEPRTLSEDEYWGPGVYDLNQSVIVPSGVTLHILDGTTIRVHGSGGIFIRVDGKLDSAGGGMGITFLSAKSAPGTRDWKGIIISGEAALQNTTIRNAERGITALPASGVTITGGAFAACRIGIHAGTEAVVTGARFESCEWYGVKEDAIVNDKRPIIVNCVFKGNGSLYYHITQLILNLAQLNGLAGNSGNEEQ